MEISLIALILASFVPSITVLFFALHLHRSHERALRSFQREQEILQKLKFSNKMALIGSITSGVAHRVSTTLHLVDEILQLANRDSKVGSRVQSLNNLAKDEIRRTLMLTNSLIPLTLPEDHADQPILLSSVVANICAEFKKSVPQAIHLDYSSESDIPLVRADQNLIWLILNNLLSNAEDAIKGRGTISVRVKKSPYNASTILKGVELNYWVSISVTDSGIGMDETTRNRLYEPFYSTKNRTDRTGLGLAIVFGIARFYDGRIEVETEVEKGTVITIQFPAFSGTPENTAIDSRVDSQSLSLTQPDTSWISRDIHGDA